jgi:hypothetical protein
MKRILRRRPSPAMAVALLGVVIGLGGVAFATIPDSSGTIHGCYVKGLGNLRVVESGSDCRSNETPIAWNQEGPPGPPGAIATRISGGPVQFDGTGSFSSPEEKEVSLTGTPWTQGPNEFREIVGQVDTETPCSDAPALRPYVLVYVDGQLAELSGLGSGFTTFRIAVFETGESRTHSVTITAGDRCGTFRGASRINSLKLNVLSFESRP